MICPKCGANVSDESRFCNMCQEPLTEEARAETAKPAAAEQPKQKNKNLPIYLAIVAVIVVVAILAAVLGSRNNSQDEDIVPAETAEASGEQVSNETGTGALGTYTEAQLDGAVARVASEGYTLDNVQFNYYYWSQYYYVLATYGESIGYYFDVTKPLSEQMMDETMSWQDFFVENAISAFIQTQSLVFKAEAEGFELPEETRAGLEQTLLELQSYAAEYEYETVDDYIAASYGAGSTFESFAAYLEDSYLSSAYTDKVYAEMSYTEADIEEYYDTYAADYEAAGIPKDDTPVVDVRHILVAFETDEEGNVTEEANAAAREEAQKLYDQWQADGATEEAFAALAAANTDDTGTAANGGLCSTIAPGDTVTAFNDWIFAEGRQAGDCELVETEFGWHVTYFVRDAGLLWQVAAESDYVYESTYGSIEQFTKDYSFEIDKSAIAINVPDDVSANYTAEETEAAAEDTEEQSAQEAAE